MELDRIFFLVIVYIKPMQSRPEKTGQPTSKETDSNSKLWKAT
jgi:hypothetical protein